jgi:hypothetical protein
MKIQGQPEAADLDNRAGQDVDRDVRLDEVTVDPRPVARSEIEIL